MCIYLSLSLSLSLSLAGSKLLACDLLFIGLCGDFFGCGDLSARDDRGASSVGCARAGDQATRWGQEVNPGTMEEPEMDLYDEFGNYCGPGELLHPSPHSWLCGSHHCASTRSGR